MSNVDDIALARATKVKELFQKGYQISDNAAEVGITIDAAYRIIKKHSRIRPEDFDPERLQQYENDAKADRRGIFGDRSCVNDMYETLNGTQDHGYDVANSYYNQGVVRISLARGQFDDEDNIGLAEVNFKEHVTIALKRVGLEHLNSALKVTHSGYVMKVSFDPSGVDNEHKAGSLLFLKAYGKLLRG